MTQPVPVLASADYRHANPYGDHYVVVPCSVDPEQVRLIIYSSGKIHFTRRCASVAAAEQIAHRYAYNEDFRKEVKAATLAEAVIQPQMEIN